MQILITKETVYCYSSDGVDLMASIPRSTPASRYGGPYSLVNFPEWSYASQKTSGSFSIEYNSFVQLTDESGVVKKKSDFSGMDEWGSYIISLFGVVAGASSCTDCIVQTVDLGDLTHAPSSDAVYKAIEGASSANSNALFVDTSSASFYNVKSTDPSLIVLINNASGNEFTLNLFNPTALSTNTQKTTVVVNNCTTTNVEIANFSNTTSWFSYSKLTPTLEFVSANRSGTPEQWVKVYYASEDRAGLLSTLSQNKIDAVNSVKFMDNNPVASYGIQQSLTVTGNEALAHWKDTRVVLNNNTANRYVKIEDMSLGVAPFGTVLDNWTFTIESYPASHKLYGMLVQTSVKCATEFIKASDGTSLGNTYTPPVAGEEITVTYNATTNKYIINEY